MFASTRVCGVAELKEEVPAGLVALALGFVFLGVVYCYAILRDLTAPDEFPFLLLYMPPPWVSVLAYFYHGSPVYQYSVTLPTAVIFSFFFYIKQWFLNSSQ